MDKQWCVWNEIGSELASSEEEAKRKAEAMIEVFDMPAYIGQATNMVKKDAKVWAK